MKKRLLSTAVGLVLLAVILFYFDTVFLNIVLAVVGQIALYEAVKAFIGKLQFGIYLCCSLFFVPFMFFNPPWLYMICALIFVLFCVMMASKEKVNFRNAASVLLVTFLITFGFLSILSMRNLGETAGDKRMMFAFGLIFGWVCDSFAYIFGRLFGKRKMSPNISPNKTVEGAIGGILSTVAVSVAAYAVYAALCPQESLFYEKTRLVHYLFFAAAGLVGAIIGMVGDLSFSYIKRECDIKDFGNIMPGHGGALDRLDSVLFTSAFASFLFVIYTNYL